MKTGADHHIGYIQAAKHSVEISRVMLAIGIHLDERLVPLAPREQEGRPHGATDAHVEGERHDDSPSLSGKECRLVGGAVIHDEDVGIGAVLADLGNDTCDRPLLIPGGDCDEHALASHKGSR